MQFIRQAKDAGHYDLIVCGAGPGGTAAAIAAARLGKKVLLIDCAGCIGGYLTSALMSIALDMPGKGGLPREIVNALTKKNRAQWVDRASYTYDIESMKLLLETMVRDAGADVLLYTRVTAVKMENGRIAAILADGFTPQAFTADYFVDGTGHGTLSMLAGCGYEMGQEDTGLLQPASLESLVVGVPEQLWHSDIHNRAVKKKLKELLLSAGVDCSYPSPLLFRLSPDSPTHKFAVNHAYHVSCEDDFSVTRGTLEARQEINRAVEALRSLSGWEGLTLVQTAEKLGLRDSRRVHGLTAVTIADALSGRIFEDSVSPVHFGLDIHKLSPDHVPAGLEKSRFQPFTVPMGALIAKDVQNLFLVGRCISGDFWTHSAYRTVNTACAVGEAVGIAAAALRPGDTAAQTDRIAIHQAMLQRGYDFSPNAE